MEKIWKPWKLKKMHLGNWLERLRLSRKWTEKGAVGIGFNYRTVKWAFCNLMLWFYCAIGPTELHFLYICERPYCRGLLLQSYKFFIVVFVFPQQKTIFCSHNGSNFSSHIIFSSTTSAKNTLFIASTYQSVQKFSESYFAKKYWFCWHLCSLF